MADDRNIQIDDVVVWWIGVGECSSRHLWMGDRPLVSTWGRSNRPGNLETSQPRKSDSFYFIFSVFFLFDFLLMPCAWLSSGALEICRLRLHG